MTTSLQPLREALTHAGMAIVRAEKALLAAARKEGTLTASWNEAAAAVEHLRTFDHHMATLKAEFDKRTS